MAREIQDEHRKHAKATTEIGEGPSASHEIVREETLSQASPAEQDRPEQTFKRASGSSQGGEGGSGGDATIIVMTPGTSMVNAPTLKESTRDMLA